jgi:flagellar protein FliL
MSADSRGEEFRAPALGAAPVRLAMAKKKEEAATEGDAPEGGKKKPRIAIGGKLPLVGGAIAAVLLLGGGGWWFFMKGKPKQEVAAAQSAGQSSASGGSSGPRKPSAFLDLPELTVNLAAGGQQDRQQFLRMKIALEVQEQKVVTEIQPMMPRVLDAFQVFMRELRPQDLEGSAGLYRLKEELTRRVNVAVFPARVEAVLFKELMVQ